ncbi:MAG: 16S rRNA (cytosine(1402)-N(4))-methyltransferase RsmH [Defluviitaleaceae bacterium]|nr:16S rRNA (cytosine(1402)-N(4))-methyltransferase RsmH [Defluviitaleaceae bacterium]
MLLETIRGLNVKPDGVYVDGTLGGGGHSERILEMLANGRLIGIDRDAEAIEAARGRLSRFGCRFEAVHGNFAELNDILEARSIGEIDGIVFDLGVSSHQIDTPGRGFSYSASAPLDMRMDRRENADAGDIINGYDENRLTEIFFKYGEERYSKRIAKAIVESRQRKKIETTSQLADIINKALPVKARYDDGGHSARRIFQAVRIEVNRELDALKTALSLATRRLAVGGRICAISFHSLEDRLVKCFFRDESNPCKCPRDFPVCACGKLPSLNIVTKKALRPCEAEIASNARAHSAKLRIAERTGHNKN